MLDSSGVNTVVGSGCARCGMGVQEYRADFGGRSANESSRAVQDVIT